jgi:hypothetical protein
LSNRRKAVDEANGTNGGRKRSWLLHGGVTRGGISSTSDGVDSITFLLRPRPAAASAVEKHVSEDKQESVASQRAVIE